MQTLRLKAPAKINLYLNVLRKRPDGYHDIETIFEKIDLCDQVVLRKRKQGIKVICRHQGVPEGKSNLGFRAAQLLFAKTNRKDGVEITIAKKIPVASGLGGGSSDAASVLLGLNKLLRLGQSEAELLELAGRLGADVPFFILPSIRAIGRGRGDILTPFKIKRKNWYVLAFPHAVAVSTRRMYQHPRIALTKSSGSVKIVIRALKKGDLTSLNRTSFNSFESVLRKRYSEIQEIKKALKSLGSCATLISGSGPCVFGIAQTRKEAIIISEKLRAKVRGWKVKVARTYNNKEE